MITRIYHLAWSIAVSLAACLFLFAACLLLGGAS